MALDKLQWIYSLGQSISEQISIDFQPDVPATWDFFDGSGFGSARALPVPSDQENRHHGPVPPRSGPRGTEASNRPATPNKKATI